MPKSKRMTFLKNEADVTAKNLENILGELESAIPSEDEYRTNKIEKKAIPKAPPADWKEGEIRFESQGSSKRLLVRIDGKMYYVNLTEVT